VTEPPVNQSIERAVRLLGLFSPDEPELPLAEVTARLGVSKATAHRYATALRRTGLLRLTPQGYALGPKLLELSATALAGLPVVTVAGPHLRRRVTVTGETAVLSVWDGEAPVVVRVDDDTDRVIRINVRTGARLAPDSAQGQVFRAHLDGEPSPAHVLSDGVAFSASRIDGIGALAAAVFQAGTIVATLALVGTLSSIESGARSAAADALREAAAALSSELGHPSAMP
jgi:DNA-binding IclR family transcriptional regulator